MSWTDFSVRLGPILPRSPLILLFFLGNPLAGFFLGGQEGFVRNAVDVGLVALVLWKLLISPSIRFDREFLYIGAALLGLAVLSSPGVHERPLVAILVDSKIIFYFLIAAVASPWGKTISAQDWLLGLRWLVVILLADFIGSYVLQIVDGGLAPPRAHGIGEPNYSAALVALALIRLGLLHIPRLDLIAAVASILATQSRTVAIILAVIVLLTFRASWKSVLPLAALGVIFVGMVLALRDSPESWLHIDRFRFLGLFIDSLDAGPWSLLIGNGPGVLVTADTGGWRVYLGVISSAIGLEGIYSFSFHLMWLRLAFTFGLIGLGVVAWFVLRQVWRSPRSTSVLGWAAFVVLSGLSMATFYLSSLAVITLVAIRDIQRCEARERASSE